MTLTNRRRSIQVLAVTFAAGTTLLSTGNAFAQTILALPTVSGGQIHTFAISGNTLYLGGDFTSIGGQARTGLASINLTNDTLNSFDPFLFNSSATTEVRSLAVTSTGDLWVGGDFDSAKALVTDAGSGRNDIAQFSAMGALNSITVANNASLSGGIGGLTLDASNNLYATGSFTSFGNGSTGNASGLAKITSTGTADNSFAPIYNGGGAIGSSFRDFVISPDGTKMYLATNSFSSYGAEGGGTASRFGFVQLNTSDGLATSFDFAGDGQGFATRIINGSLYLGGSFSNIDGSARKDVAKFTDINGTPTLDATFAPTSSTNGPSSAVRGIAGVGNDIYMIGDFSSYAGVADNGFVAVDATTGALDTSVNVTASQNFSGNGNAIIGYGGGSPAVFVTDGPGGNGGSVTVAGGDGVMHASPYYAGIGGIGGAAAAPEPGAFALLASVALPGGLLLRRRKRSA